MESEENQNISKGNSSSANDKLAGVNDFDEEKVIFFQLFTNFLYYKKNKQYSNSSCMK